MRRQDKKPVEKQAKPVTEPRSVFPGDLCSKRVIVSVEPASLGLYQHCVRSLVNHAADVVMQTKFYVSLGSLASTVTLSNEESEISTCQRYGSQLRVTL